ncbi:hypothetical protein Dacet_0486 [Denitrovibrio acetiphilus DSM 12809]|jgi:prepilin-type N-terminal cleavage/methylation domain-containing protein|uniref:Uncharacterized protein n=1 Tax=Denitrovibrio acetiphilus (strain DSM 12809 / NBRC 114555 / N2460) TaxID=522772 RepID=D4H3X3_DENA2|nr:type II secretion system protein [Denitrovibrio acetiphilus]ADD67284.1 hypothetical protein Dacet_0486 [Denitrovibrio acetiphilus DSM 12809]
MKRKQGFTLVEILIVMVIAGIGLMTVAPKLAQNTILSDSTETFFQEIIDSHLKAATELNTQVFITGYKGSDTIQLFDGTRVSIPAGDVRTVHINEETATGAEFRIYFYTDGLFDQFRIEFRNKSELESYPALLQVVMK